MAFCYSSQSVHSLSHARLFATPWTTAHQASLSITKFWLELSQTHAHWVGDTIQPSHPLSTPSPPAFNLPSIRIFPMSQFFPSDGQSIGVSASASVLPMSIQSWFPLGLTALICLQSSRLLRVFLNTTVQKHQFFSAQLSLWSNSLIHTWLLGKP